MSADDKLYDWIVAKWFPSPLTKADKSRIGMLARDFKVKGATVETMASALARYKREWPKAEASPGALLKHWDRFQQDKDVTPTITPGHSKAESEERRMQFLANHWYRNLTPLEQAAVWGRVSEHIRQKHDEAKAKEIEGDGERRVAAMWWFEVRGLR